MDNHPCMKAVRELAEASKEVEEAQAEEDREGLKQVEDNEELPELKHHGTKTPRLEKALKAFKAKSDALEECKKEYGLA